MAGYQWSGVQDWTTPNPAPWIDDPGGNIRYEAHHYWDSDHSGGYRAGYAAELDAVRARQAR